MRLNDMSDYAFRVLIYAAEHQGELFRISDLVAHYGLSQGTVMKVVRKLSKEGYLKAQRGRSGGLMLGREPTEINLGQVARYMEPDFNVVECMRIENKCTISGSCQLRGPVEEATRAFLNTLDRYSLADISQPQRT